MSTPRDLTAEPIEEQIHAAVETLLLAARGNAGELYHPPDHVGRVPIPSIQYVPEKRGAVVYLMTPQSDAIYTVLDTCADELAGAILITAIMKWEKGNEPWAPGFVPRARAQFRMLSDLRWLLNGASLPGDAQLRLTSRNVDGLDTEFFTAVQGIFELKFREA